MCGIIGIVSNCNVVQAILKTLQNLEYRGYDSAGIAVNTSANLQCVKVVGKVIDLEQAVKQKDLRGNIGIGHTRWATHGEVSVNNAHPHFTKRVALIHNGVIENYAQLKKELVQAGYVFASQTDSEAIVLLIDSYLMKGYSPLEAVRNSISKLEGSFALAIIFNDYPSLMIGVRINSPLIVGLMNDSKTFYLSSDTASICEMIDKVLYLENNSIAVIEKSTLTVYNGDGEIAIDLDIKNVIEEEKYKTSKNGYDHFMIKEIMEQPVVITNTLAGLDSLAYLIKINGIGVRFTKIIIVACGTSYYAGLVAKYWFDTLTTIESEVYIASEFCYLNKKLHSNTCVIFISQSGETADTLMALRAVSKQGIFSIGIVNVKNSSIDNEVDLSLYTLAGKEVGVASTKVFTAQLVLLFKLIIDIGFTKGEVLTEQYNNNLAELYAITKKIECVLENRRTVEQIAHTIVKYSNALYLARNLLYPIAMEGALKLKEVSYIHAEGYAAGELKHGPLAMVDEKMPVIVLANSDSHTYLKTISNLENVSSRNGRIFLFSDIKINTEVAGYCELPASSEYLAPILYVIPLQLLAYYVAVQKGTNVDQPKNLAKSVTVE